MNLDSINKTVDSSKINFNKTTRSKLTFWGLIFLISIILIFTILAFIFIDKLNEGQIMLASVFGSFLVSVLILLMTLNIEERRAYLEARKSANVLTQILSAINEQVTQIKHGSNLPITFLTDWLDFYLDCALYLKYDYLNVLFREFKFVKQINNCEGLEDKCKFIEERKKSLTLSNDFNIYEMQLNLSLFSMGKKEDEPWKNSKEYKKFAKDFQIKYSDNIRYMALNYIKEHGSTDANVVNSYIRKILEEDESFQKFTKKYEINIGERELSNEIFKCFLNTNSQSGFKLIWGKLHLH